MAKKKKITIINQELTPTVLAVKEDKKTVSMIGFLWITLIFIAFIASVLYLPQLTKLVKKVFPFLNIDDEETYPVNVKSNTPSTTDNQTTTQDKTLEQEETSVVSLIINGESLDYNSKYGVQTFYNINS